jgi:hypothetical protein
VVQELINKGADVTVKAKDGRTAMLIARTENDSDIIAILESASASQSGK